VVTAFFAAGLATGFALTTDFAGCFAVFAAPDLATTGAFALTAIFFDSTALFAGVFFAAGLIVDLLAGFSDSVSALTIFFAKVFTGDFAAGFLTAGLARAGVATLGAIFFVLLADFVTVAFMVPCPLNELAELANTQIGRALRAIHSPRIVQARYLLSAKPQQFIPNIVAIRE